MSFTLIRESLEHIVCMVEDGYLGIANRDTSHHPAAVFVDRLQDRVESLSGSSLKNLRSLQQRGIVPLDPGLLLVVEAADLAAGSLIRRDTVFWQGPTVSRNCFADNGSRRDDLGLHAHIVRRIHALQRRLGRVGV